MLDGFGRNERSRIAARVQALVRPGDAEPGEDLPLAGLRARVPLRVDPGRRAAIAVGVVALVAAVVTCWQVFGSPPHAVPVLAAAPTAPVSHGGAVSRTAPSAQPIVVDVAGKVAHPGLYKLAAGARVADAIAAAGGVRKGFDTSAINLAARVADGQQVLVEPGAGVLTSDGATGNAGGTGAAGAAGPVSLNNATLEQLQTLPGVGPVLAQHILDWRTAHGGFASITQLNDVPGIGDVKFASLKPLVTL